MLNCCLAADTNFAGTERQMSSKRSRPTKNGLACALLWPSVACSGQWACFPFIDTESLYVCLFSPHDLLLCMAS